MILLSQQQSQERKVEEIAIQDIEHVTEQVLCESGRLRAVVAADADHLRRPVLHVHLNVDTHLSLDFPVAAAVSQRPGDIGQRGQIGAVAGDDAPDDAAQRVVACAKAPGPLVEIGDDRLKVLGIEDGQRVGGGGAGQPVQVELAVEVAAAFDQAQRADDRVVEAQEQADEQLVIGKLAVAVSRQRPQATQMGVEKVHGLGVGLEQSWRRSMASHNLHERSVPCSRQKRKLRFG